VFVLSEIVAVVVFDGPPFSIHVHLKNSEVVKMCWNIIQPRDSIMRNLSEALEMYHLDGM
jgi:hypothetical protein